MRRDETRIRPSGPALQTGSAGKLGRRGATGHHSAIPEPGGQRLNGPTESNDRQRVAERAANLLVAGFVDYNRNFSDISRRARQRFEQRDWAGTRGDVAARIDLYTAGVAAITGTVQEALGTDSASRDLWHEIRRAYATQIHGRTDVEFYKTWFSSVTRQVFDTLGVDPHVEFLAREIEPSPRSRRGTALQVYAGYPSLTSTVAAILRDCAFAVPYTDAAASAEFVAARIEASPPARRLGVSGAGVELLAPVFYQSNRAYLVGRVLGGDWTEPLVIALRNDPGGIEVDAVLLNTDQLSVLFGYTRSYFLADIDAVGATVSYLQDLMPHKPRDELYTVLGRAKQGKTERYRSFYRHLDSATDQFRQADGDRGMVMAVFTLPSYDLVFKVIRDRFAYPKDTIREEVMAKYDLVFKRDRAGRLVDAQPFRRLEFPRTRFAPELLDELLTECGNTCRLVGDNVLVEHLYVERRLRPLNLYLRECDDAQARDAIVDYGQAIRDLAVTNIFPGDLLLKNFGVSRLGRVVFYDYDELCLVTECQFRELPTAADDDTRAPDWFYVGAHDVFPEQWLPFLGFNPEQKAVFIRHHGEVLTAQYWDRLKHKHLSGQVTEVIPYWSLDRRPPAPYRGSKN